MDGTRQTIDTVVWATGFEAALPFLPDALIRREAGVPLRVAGCILPAGGPARLYFVGLCAPRGPQLPVYSAQSEVIMDMLDQQERLDQPLVATFSAEERPEARIDIVRADWNKQMERTRRRLGAPGIVGSRRGHDTAGRPGLREGGPLMGRVAVITGAATASGSPAPNGS